MALAGSVLSGNLASAAGLTAPGLCGSTARSSSLFLSCQNCSSSLSSASDVALLYLK